MALDANRLSQAIYSGITAAGIPDPVENLKKVADAIATAIVAEVTGYAEVVVPAGTIPAGAVTVGAGAAAVPSPTPIPILQPAVPPGGVK